MDKSKKPGSENKSTSGKKTRFYLAVMLVGVALVAVALYKGSNKETAENNDEPKNVETAGSNESGTFYEGVLEKTDDAGKGNYKLVSGTHDIYLRTSRDFSALIGAQVFVSIEGTLENFKLLDIQSKIEKDGFIKSN